MPYQPTDSPADYAIPKHDQEVPDVEVVDPDGPGPAPDADYEVLPDGDYPQEETGETYPEVGAPDRLIVDP